MPLVSCYGKSFEDQEIAELMNQAFVNIKVDRGETRY